MFERRSLIEWSLDAKLAEADLDYARYLALSAGLPVEAPTEVPTAPAPDHPGTAAEVSLVAGSGSPGYADGEGAAARFDSPSGVAAGADAVEIHGVPLKSGSGPHRLLA